MSFEEFLRREIKTELVLPPRGWPEFNGFNVVEAGDCESFDIRSSPGMFDSIVNAVTLYSMTCDYAAEYVYLRGSMVSNAHAKDTHRLIRERVKRAKKERIRDIIAILLYVKDEKGIFDHYESRIIIGEHHGFVSVCKLPFSH